VPLTVRRGITLVELLVALVLLGILGSLAGRALLSQGRAAGALKERHQAQSTIDQATSWISSELVDLGFGDLVRLGADSLTYRAFRSVGLACLVAPGEVRIRRDLLSFWRVPQPGRDSLLLLMATDSLPRASAWAAFPILSVGVSSCAGLPALRLGIGVTTALPAGAPPLVPVRTFEVMQLRRYRSQGKWWLGARSESAGEALQPVTGPLAEGGFQLTYRDVLGTEVAFPGEVRRVELYLEPASQRDSVRLLIQPRNLLP
jgi:prepilin-type N-terminal cleavage/methylation domain-containing protein